MKVTTIRNLIFMTVILAVSVAFTPTQAAPSPTDPQTCCEKIQDACKKDGGNPSVEVCNSGITVIVCVNQPLASNPKTKAACLACGGTFIDLAGIGTCESFDP
jgi:hypothetical protein